MSLFVVNRYLGDGNDEKCEKSNDLNKLLLKVEERRKLKEENERVARANGVNVRESKKERHKRLRKLRRKEEKNQKKGENDDNEEGVSGEEGNEGDKCNEFEDQDIELPESGQDSLKKNEGEKSESPGFTVIGGHDFKKKIEVKRYLPDWLAKPFRIPTDLKNLSTTVNDLPDLDKTIVDNLKKHGVTHFFPVQKEVIPWVLHERQKCSTGLKHWPRDVCVSVPTGSGKTLAFVLPVIQSLKPSLIRRVRALVVLPVQDLAAQVAKVFVQYAQGTGLRVLTVTGRAMPLHTEQSLLVRQRVDGGFDSRVDIVVTTPGRLVEHLTQTAGFTLSHLQFVVVDEADRVIDNVKNDWLYHLENHLLAAGIKRIPALTLDTLNSDPVRPQKLLFSATMTQDPEKLKLLNLFQPRLFTSSLDSANETKNGGGKDDNAGDLVLPAELQQKWLSCSHEQLKPLILYHVLATEGWRGVLCFTHYTDATRRLARLLSLICAACRLQLTVDEISSEVSFEQRNRIVAEFTRGDIDVLVCSDAYARGMDISGVRYVILYSPPKHLNNYIHQVGRTARAGVAGTSLTLLNPPQVKSFHKLLKMSSFTGKLEEMKIDEKELSYLEEPYRDSLTALKNEATDSN
ncbi:hypothetical protein LSTR_LSTR007243 [Laodelphax striatellus]|uniref:ATP-dependent RNA helicase n=1 Tax=Laodelphax striatellus TaxID=195883 RepID=A0A482XDY8_LAOST|nr:hypothetical protein LSTR_LSTR007243 [Laodelphax striatellus]